MYIDINATTKTKKEAASVSASEKNTFARPILDLIESKGNNDNKKDDPYCIVFAVGSFFLSEIIRYCLFFLRRLPLIFS